MVIDTSKSGWEKELIKAQMSAYITQAKDKIINILIDAFTDEVADFYMNYSQEVYPRTYAFYDLPIEITPIISGKSVTIGIKLDKSKLPRNEWQSGRFSGTTHGYDLEKLLVNEILHGIHGGQSEEDINMIENIINNIEVYDAIVNNVKNGLANTGFVIV